LVHYSHTTDSIVPCDGGVFYLSRSKKETPFQLHFSKFTVHPLYSSNPTITSGYDLAVVQMENTTALHKHPILKDKEYRSYQHGFYWHHLDTPDKNYKAKVMGYPGENDKVGDMYQMTGSLHCAKNKPQGTQILFYKDIDTTPGQSGSPLLVMVDSYWQIVGIHVGFLEADKCNVATGISPTVYAWIGSQIDVLGTTL